MTTFDHPNHVETRVTPAVARDVFEAQLWRFLDTVDAVFARTRISGDAQRDKAARRADARAAADRLLLQ